MLALLTLAMVGCTNKNVPLNPVNVALESRAHNQTRASTGIASIPDMPTPARGKPGPQPASKTGYFIGVAISGGGSRSANFSAAVMLQLQRIGILQKADYISSVSGGSLTAAYYCAADDRDWNPQTVQQKLTYPFARDLIVKFLSPWYGAAIIFTDYDRSDLLAEVFQRVLFTRNTRRLTFGDLRPDRPHLLINATDLQSGRKFVFCDETFDDLNSNLSRYPLAWACAASAAVPVLLHQVTLRDYSTSFRQYRHFIDGGIADNLGVQTLVEVYDQQNQRAAERHEPPPYPKGAILIVIDAKTRFNARISNEGDIGFLKTLEFGSGLTSTALLSRASDATLADLIVKYSPPEMTAEQIRKHSKDLTTTGYTQLSDREHRPVHIVHFALAQLSGLANKVPFQSFSESLDNIATYFNIDATDAYNLYQAADLLMKERFEPVLRPLMVEISGKAP